MVWLTNAQLGDDVRQNTQSGREGKDGCRGGKTTAFSEGFKVLRDHNSAKRWEQDYEPAWGAPIGFQVQLLNHSDITASPSTPLINETPQPQKTPIYSVLYQSWSLLFIWYVYFKQYTQGARSPNPSIRFLHSAPSQPHPAWPHLYRPQAVKYHLFERKQYSSITRILDFQEFSIVYMDCIVSWQAMK